MEEKRLRESYKKHIKNLKEISLKEYLKTGFSLDKESILKAIDYFKICLPKEIKEIILKQNYWNLYYNDPMKKLLIETLNLTKEEDKKAISTFVYTFQGDKTNFENLEDENKLKEKLLKDGYKEGKFLKYLDKETEEDFKKRCENYYKPFNNLKVKCVLDISKIGLLGSFDKTEEIEGKFFYSEYTNKLMIIPKRCRTRGFIIRTRFYYKEIKN